MQKRTLGKSHLDVSALLSEAGVQTIRRQLGKGFLTGKIDENNLREIDGAAAEMTVHGARYPEHLQKLVGR
jgi:hypothetical protein